MAIVIIIIFFIMAIAIITLYDRTMENENYYRFLKRIKKYLEAQNKRLMYENDNLVRVINTLMNRIDELERNEHNG
jgi:hypothetical protein